MISKTPARKKLSHKLSYTGERLVQNERILEPLRIENLARFNYFRNFISEGRILDYGCGTGEGTHFLSTYDSYKVVGIDISYGAIKDATDHYQNGNLKFVCGDILARPFKKQYFDGIISIEVVEHIGDSDRYLNNIIYLLNPDGVFMLTTPNRLLSSPTPDSLWPDHVIEYEANELLNLLKEYFKEVIILGEYIPLYEENRLRKIIRKMSPKIKPILPKWLRVRALPFLFSLIKSDLKLNEVVFTSTNIDQCPTLVALCKIPKINQSNNKSCED